MGFRFRKSIRLGKYARLNFSKSGVGWSLGTKAVRFTKKSSGGTRTTSTIPGTGISYVSESGSGRSKKAPPARNQSQNQSTAKGSGSFLYYCLCALVVALVASVNSNDTTYWIITAIIAAACVLCVCFRSNANKTAPNETNDSPSKEDLLQLQKILIQDSPDHLVLTRSQILEQVQLRLSDNMRIIKESASIMESTCDIDTFFTRADLILEKYEDCMIYEPYVPFADHSASAAYDQALSEIAEELKKFVKRHIGNLLLNAAPLKTEKGRQNRYIKSYESFKKYQDQIDPSTWEMIEAEFQTLIK